MSKVFYADRAVMMVNGKALPLAAVNGVSFVHTPNPIPVEGEMLSPANADGIRGRRLPCYENWHPIKFAKFCYCRQCKKLCHLVETNHPNGVTQGPWEVIVQCHGDSHTIKLSSEEVASVIKSGGTAVHHMAFFGKDPTGKAYKPRLLTQAEIEEYTKKGLI